MRELRISFGLDRDDVAAYAQEIKDGTREPSSTLRLMRRELYRRTTLDAVKQFQASLRNREMENPSELDLYGMHKQLPIYERRYLFLECEEIKMEYEGKFRPFEGIPRINASPEDHAQQNNESLRQYLTERRARETKLIQAALSVSSEGREAGASQEIKEEKGHKTARSLSPEELAAIRERARLQAWDRLVPEEVFAENPGKEARALSDAIAEMKEKIQPQTSLATRALNELSLKVTGHLYHEMPVKAFRKLSPDDARRLEEHRQYAERSLERLYDGFEKIDRLRQEIERSRMTAGQLDSAIPVNVVEAQTPAQTSPQGKEPEATVSVDPAVKEAGERENPQPARRAPGEPPIESRSYREYVAAAAEIERQLIEEAVREKQNLTKDQPEIATADILLSRDEKLRIRADATRRALTRLEPQRILAKDPATISLLELQGTVRYLRDEAQPQARETAGKVDAFIRSRGLERFIEKKTDYYYRGDQLPESALKELTLDERRTFEALENQASEAFREFKAGFWVVDQLRTEIDWARGGHTAPVEPKSRGKPGKPGGGGPPEIRSSLNGFWRRYSPRHYRQSDTETAVRATEAPVPAQVMKESGGRQTPPAFPLSKSTGESRSYREYVIAVAETEQRLLGEFERLMTKTAAQDGPGIGQGGPEAASTDISINREEKLRIRSFAINLAWAELEPRPMSTNDPAAVQILSLREKIEHLRDEVQPQLWKADWKLDAFIRTRGLAESIAEKTEYFYRADQVPKRELAKLSPGEKREFAAREHHASAALHNFKAGFDAIDRLRGEIERIDDRVILGRAIIAHAHSDAAALDFDIADRFGHTFRFEIEDASVGARRRISDLDVRLRAKAHGGSVADEAGLERYDDRLKTLTQVSEADIIAHSTTLDEHGSKLDRLTGELETEARQSLAVHLRAQRLATEVAEKYGAMGTPLPTPLVERGVLVEAQDEAIEHRLASHTEKLEWLRVALAEKHGQPMRSDTEMARLSAQVFTARTELLAQEAHARRFDETRHLRQWEIAIDRQGRIVPDRQEEVAVDKQGARVEKFSLAQIDREIKELADETRMNGKRLLLLDYIQDRKTEAKIERFGRIREAVIGKIEERQSEFKERVAEARRLHDTLVRAYEREASFREQMGLEMPARQFTRSEMERAAKNIETARDAEGLRELSREERRFNEYADRKEWFKPVEEWGRAPGRALMAEIFYRESAGRLEASEQRGKRQPMLIERRGGALHVERLTDTYPKSSAEWALRPLLELVSEKARADREARQNVQDAYAQHEAQLQGDVELHRVYMETARGIASEQAAERARTPGLDLPESPLALTADQAMKLEIYATRQTDPEVRREMLGLARGSAKSHFDPYSQALTRSDESEPSHEKSPEVGRTR